MVVVDRYWTWLLVIIVTAVVMYEVNCLSTIVSLAQRGPAASAAVNDVIQQQQHNINGKMDPPYASKPPGFGADMLQMEFMLASNYVNLNHGSYGAVPRKVLEAKQALERRVEERPDIWMRKDYYGLLDSARADVAAMIGAEAEDVVLVDNASTAVNAVVRSLPWKKGDKVLILSTAYGMVREVLRYLKEKEGVEAIEVPIDFPMVDETQILESVTAALDKAKADQHCKQQSSLSSSSSSSSHASSATDDNQPPIRLALFSHITSAPALLLPIEKLVALCKSYGSSSNSGGSGGGDDGGGGNSGGEVSVLIDGAHAIGQVAQIDVTKIGADYYLSNLHKWCFAPKTASVLWVKRDKQRDVLPPVISGSGKRDFAGSFEYVGTRDYTSLIGVTAALSWRKWVGEQAIIDYNRALAAWTGSYLAKKWKTELLVPPEMTLFMTNVRLPTDSIEAAQMMQEKLYSQHGVYIIVKEAEPGVVYCRLSAQVYLEKDDFVLLGDVVPLLLEEAEADRVQSAHLADDIVEKY